VDTDPERESKIDAVFVDHSEVPRPFSPPVRPIHAAHSEPDAPYLLIGRENLYILQQGGLSSGDIELVQPTQ
jgi:hypothetical protein